MFDFLGDIVAGILGEALFRRASPQAQRAWRAFAAILVLALVGIFVYAVVTGP